MPSVNRARRRIDEPREGAAVGTPLGDATTPAPPSIGILVAPTDLQIISSGAYQSGQGAFAAANLRWRPPPAVPLRGHVVRWSRVADFATFVDVPADASGSAGIQGLPAGERVYFKVAALAQNGQQSSFSAPVDGVMPQDLTPPAPVVNLSYTWSGRTGNLILTSTPPTSANIRGIEYQIFASNGGPLLRTAITSSGLFIWTLDMQRDDRNKAQLFPADATCYVTATTITWEGTRSATVTQTPTILPPTPIVGAIVANWRNQNIVDNSDGLESADFIFSINELIPPPLEYLIQYMINTSPARVRSGLRGQRYVDYAFTYDQNIRYTSPGHPYGFPSITLSVRSIDVYQQSSPEFTLTLVNKAPPATTIAASGTANTVVLSIAPSLAQDLRGYRIRVYKNGTELPSRAFEVTSTTVTYAVQDGDGSYQFSVAPVDLFNQYAAESALTTPIALEALTLENIREAAVYSDSITTAPATLKAQLADDDRDSGGITYFAPSTAWQWVQVDRQLQDRLGPTILSASGGASSHGLGYLAISQDAATWRFYAGPATPNAVLAFRGSGALGSAAEVSARANAVPLPLIASSQRWILPDIQEARYIRLGFYSVMFPANITLYEFYPQSLIVADQILGGTIRGLKMIGNEIEGGTITGAQIQTETTGQRVELTTFGLRTYDAAGNIVLEAGTTTGGALRGGLGFYRLDRTNLILLSALDAGGNYLGGGLTLQNQDEQTRGLLYVRETLTDDGTVTLDVASFGSEFRVIGHISAGSMSAGHVALSPVAAASVGSGLFIDAADGDLKIKFANGIVKTIATND